MANVTNADVDAAIALKYALDDIGSTSWSARSDHPANHPVPQAFAQHRTQATAELVGVLDLICQRADEVQEISGGTLQHSDLLVATIAARTILAKHKEN